MTGANKIQLNKATMVEAIQCYFDTLFLAGKVPKVVGVSRKEGYVETFEIEIDDGASDFPTTKGG